MVLAGSGTAFCAGIDLLELSQNAPDRGEPASAKFFEVLEAIRTHSAVFIAAVNGYALGGGLTLVHTCDLAIASENAQFGTPEMSFGAFPALAGPATLHRLLPKHAAQLILTAKRVNAATGLAWGIVNEVVDGPDAVPRAIELATDMATYDGTVLSHSKRLLGELRVLDWTPPFSPAWRYPRFSSTRKPRWAKSSGERTSRVCPASCLRQSCGFIRTGRSIASRT